MFQVRVLQTLGQTRQLIKSMLKQALGSFAGYFWRAQCDNTHRSLLKKLHFAPCALDLFKRTQILKIIHAVLLCPGSHTEYHSMVWGLALHMAH